MAKGRKRSDAQRRIDMVRLIELFGEGMSETDIAHELGLSQQQVSYDLKSLKSLLIQANRANMEEKRAVAIARLERLYVESWRGWHESKKERVISFAEKSAKDGSEGDAPGPTRTRSGARKEQREGNPSFLREARECEAAIAALQGLAGPIRHEFTGPNGGPIQPVEVGLTMEERLARIAAIVAAMREAGTLPPGLLEPGGQEG